MTCEQLAVIVAASATFLAAHPDGLLYRLGNQIAGALCIGVLAAGVVVLLRVALTAAGLA